MQLSLLVTCLLMWQQNSLNGQQRLWMLVWSLTTICEGLLMFQWIVCQRIRSVEDLACCQSSTT
jgi:hypothetical protein